MSFKSILTKFKKQSASNHLKFLDNFYTYDKIPTHEGCIKTEPINKEDPVFVFHENKLIGTYIYIDDGYYLENSNELFTILKN